MSPDAAHDVPDALPPTRAAPLRRRLAATVYEALLLAALAILVGFVTLPSVGPRPASVVLNAPIPLPSPMGRATSFAALFVAWAIYCVGFWSAGRRTLPMRTWKLVLETQQGAAIGFRVAALRYVACWIGPACAIGAYVVLHPHGAGPWAMLLVGVNYAWALLDPGRQFLQDRVAGSRLRMQESAQVVAP